MSEVFYSSQPAHRLAGRARDPLPLAEFFGAGNGAVHHGRRFGRLPAPQAVVQLESGMMCNGHGCQPRALYQSEQ